MAASGITGLEMAVNSLDAQTTAGNIDLASFDGEHEKSIGLDVVRATTALNSGSSVRIDAEQELRVGADGVVQGDTLYLISGTNIDVDQPTAGDSLRYTAGVSFVAGEVISLYQFFTAPTLMEYRAGDFFIFGEGGAATKLLPSTLSADTLILETGGTLSMGIPDNPVTTGVNEAVRASLSAGKHLELIAGENIIFYGDITAIPSDADGRIDSVLIKARGAQNVTKAIDLNGDGDFVDVIAETQHIADYNHDGDYDDVLNEFTDNIDYNADGDKLDVALRESERTDIDGDGYFDHNVSEAGVSLPSGYVSLQLGALEADNFELRALRDIALAKSSSLMLTGFIGGLQNFDSARNVTLDIQGTLTVESGIVAADESEGVLKLTASSISADSASVFIANTLEVSARSEEHTSELSH